MNKRIMKKKAFSVVNKATEFKLRVKYPKTFIKEGYKLMKIFKANPDMFIMRGQRVEKLSDITPAEAMLMWGDPKFWEDRKRKQAFLDRYCNDVVFITDEAFEKMMATWHLKGILMKKKNRRKKEVMNRCLRNICR